MMGTNTLDEEKIWNLTEAEVEDLFYLCKGWKNAQIADARGVGISTVKSQLGNVYSDLDIPTDLEDGDKREYLIAKYCEVVHEIVPDRESIKTFLARKKLREAENKRKQMELDRILGDRHTDSDKPNTNREMEESPPLPRGLNILLIVLGVIVVVIVTVVISNVFGGDGPEQPEVLIPTTQVQLSAPTTITSLSSEPGSNLQPPNDVTSTIAVTNSPTPSQTPTPTSTKTSVPTITQTLFPSLTPTSPYLFETSFDRGFPDGMQVVRGDIENLDFVGGQLLAHDYVLLAIGDDNWKNYQIEYEAKKSPYCWGLQENGIAAHAIDQDNMVIFSWNYCETGWFKIVNGEWTTIVSGRDKSADSRYMTKFQIIAKDGNFDLYIDNQKNSSYFNDKYLQGKAYILVSDSSVIDNIKVIQLP